MVFTHFHSFYKLYKLSIRLRNDFLMELGSDILYKAGFDKHYINYAVYDDDILNIGTPAFSLGFNIIYPFGSVFIHIGIYLRLKGVGLNMYLPMRPHISS